MKQSLFAYIILQTVRCCCSSMEFRSLLAVKQPTKRPSKAPVSRPSQQPSLSPTMSLMKIPLESIRMQINLFPIPAATTIPYDQIETILEAHLTSFFSTDPALSHSFQSVSLQSASNGSQVPTRHVRVLKSNIIQLEYEGEATFTTDGAPSIEVVTLKELIALSKEPWSSYLASQYQSRQIGTMKMLTRPSNDANFDRTRRIFIGISISAGLIIVLLLLFSIFYFKRVRNSSTTKGSGSGTVDTTVMESSFTTCNEPDIELWLSPLAKNTLYESDIPEINVFPRLICSDKKSNDRNIYQDDGVNDPCDDLETKMIKVREEIHERINVQPQSNDIRHEDISDVFDGLSTGSNDHSSSSSTCSSSTSHS